MVKWIFLAIITYGVGLLLYEIKNPLRVDGEENKIEEK